MRRRRVRIIADAEQDLFELYDYIARHDSEGRAQYVLDRLEAVCSDLAELSERGHFPPELDRIGVHDFREEHFKPYRVIYQVVGAEVLVHCVLDGRRDLQTVLERRLIRVGSTG